MSLLLRLIRSLWQASLRAIRALFALVTPRPSAPPPASPPPPPPLPPPAAPAPSTNQPPSVRIVTPSGGTVSAAVAVRYDLFDTESDALSIAVRYSTDGGNTFNPATEASGAGSEGTTNLASSPAGVRHLFVWDSAHDLGVAAAQGLLVRIIASDQQIGGTDTSPPFSTSTNLPPSIRITRIDASRTSPLVPIHYLLADNESDLSRIQATYSTDGGVTFTAATEAPGVGSEGLLGLATNRTGEAHLFVWDAATDLGTPMATNLIFRLRALDTNQGGQDTSPPFSLGHNVAPTVRIAAPTGGIVGAPVAFRYVIADPDSDGADVEISYSIDGGTTFHPATEAQLAGSQGTSSLVTIPAGLAHVFLWDAVADTGSASHTGILLRVQARDVDRGNVAISRPFDVRPTLAPAVRILAPSSGTWGRSHAGDLPTRRPELGTGQHSRLFFHRRRSDVRSRDAIPAAGW